MYFVICPKQGPKVEGFVKSRVDILRLFTLSGTPSPKHGSSAPHPPGGCCIQQCWMMLYPFFFLNDPSWYLDLVSGLQFDIALMCLQINVSASQLERSFLLGPGVPPASFNTTKSVMQEGIIDNHAMTLASRPMT